jgi:hypothetical protein
MHERMSNSATSRLNAAVALSTSLRREAIWSIVQERLCWSGNLDIEVDVFGSVAHTYIVRSVAFSSGGNTDLFVKLWWFKSGFENEITRAALHREFYHFRRIKIELRYLVTQRFNYGMHVNGV